MTDTPIDTDPSTRPSTRPMGLTPERARAWLESPDQGRPGLTVARGLAIDDWFSYCELSFIDPFAARLPALIAAASRDSLFGKDRSVVLLLTHGNDGEVDGALIVVGTTPDTRIRLSSLHRNFDDLTTDREACGIDAAVAVLEAVAFEAQTLLTEWTRATGAGAPGGPARSVLDDNERNPIEFGATLDMLACDVADLLDRGNYGIRVSQDDIRPALPAFLAAIMENAVTGGTG